MIGTWRQQQAQEALQDHLIDSHGAVTVEAADAIADTVKIATTVKITQDALDALMHPEDAANQRVTREQLAAHLAEILQVLGFEVVGA